MRTLCTSMLCGALMLGSAGLSGCQTDEPGVKSSYRSQWKTVSGTPSKVAEASEDVLQDMKLKNITKSATEVDGTVVAYTADNTKITIDIKKEGANTSQVSVNVGAMGDPDMGKDILRRIEEELD
jgi:hypothetical protein